jgi:predicted nucleotidyltransferase
VAERARSEGIPFMLFGAFAREIHFYHVWNIEGGRRTEDIDISVQVPDWAAYNGFRRALEPDGFLPESGEHPEKLVCDRTGQELDLLPFGEIADEGPTIRWPVDNSPWSVLGFDEAFAQSDTLVFRDSMDQKLAVAVAPITGLAVLKLVAITDRPERRHKKDGTDIAFIIANYLDVGNRERLLHGDDKDIMVSVKGDLAMASARLLGRDMARLVVQPTRERVGELLAHDVESDSRCFLVRGLIGRHFPGFPAARTAAVQILEGMHDCA